MARYYPRSPLENENFRPSCGTWALGFAGRVRPETLRQVGHFSILRCSGWDHQRPKYDHGIQLILPQKTKAILDAIERGAIDGQKVGRNFLVRKNGKFERWTPNPRRQQAGRDGHRSSGRKG